MSSRTSSNEVTGTQLRTSDTRFFGHPLPLLQLFNLELWERFSYYGMNGILVIYLYFSLADGGLGMPEATAVGIGGAYGGAVFLATILGAWLADRLLGAERVLFGSAAVIMVGHICLALIPGYGGIAAGLILVALGSGGLKANASAIVGELYDEHDHRRESGFTLFYMGVNLGAFLGPFVTGLLQSRIGFHWGFGAAAVGMAIGLIVYMSGRKNLPESSKDAVNPIAITKVTPYVGALVLAVILIIVLWTTGVVNPENLDWWIAGISVFAAVCYFAVMLRSKQTDSVERSRLIAFIPFFIVVIMFWALYQQVFGVLTVYSDHSLNRSIFGWEMPIAWISLIPAFFVIVFAPVFSTIWIKLKERQITTPTKMGLAVIFIGIAYLLFIPFADAGDHATPLLWVVLILALFVFGELLISPVGLSFTTRVAPRAFESQMIAVYYLASGVGTALAGVMGGFYDQNNQTPYWTVLGIASIIIGIIGLALKPFMLKALRGVR